VVLIAIKPVVAVTVLALLWLGENWLPFFAEFRGGLREKLRHDGRNLVFGLVNGILTGLVLAACLALVADAAARRGIGLLRLVHGPFWLETAAVLVLFDLWMYVWHRANHAIPFLWRFHRMHHSDPDLDATTGLRFHPGEILLSGIARLLVVPLLGMSLWQLALYESILLPVVFFHHSNVRLPHWLDYGLLAVMVTPAMHRVHHSRWQPETDSNYASVLPWWDMLLRTFRLRADEHTIRPGLEAWDGPAWQKAWGMARMPFAGSV
jgi:sterol desaturase/sphingolipid hydroxylase (fatty acid hydroxylase superfamily)